MTAAAATGQPAKSKRLAAAPAPAEVPDDTIEPDKPAEVNLNDAVVTLEWNGQVVGTVPKRRGRWPSKAGRLFEEDKYVGALKSLLGEEAYTRLEEEICPVIDDLNAFADHAGTVINRECVP